MPSNQDLCLPPGYQRRLTAKAFDDRPLKDEWQNAVYAYAYRIAANKGFQDIVDFGCGSGFKLIKFFERFNTRGYELEPALSYLRAAYPGRRWESGAAVKKLDLSGDLLICSDVIEHLPDPRTLLNKLAGSKLAAIVLSTPALEILAERGQSPRLGPPNNESHYNEWTTAEFGTLIWQYLWVDEHIVVDAGQGTQLILCHPKT